MANGFVQVAPDSTGARLQTFENLVGGQTVDAQAVVLVDSSGNPISSSSAPGSGATGIIVRSPMETSLSDGSQKAILRGGAKGTTSAADVTSAAIDANTQAIHAQLVASAAIIGVVDCAELPAAAALADATANPTASVIGSPSLLFNGSTWDRERNNASVSMGDGGVKTATFVGATQTNHNARGVMIHIAVGTVSGTSPTLSIVLQLSLDGGTTWLAMNGALPNITASSTNAAIFVYPTNFSVAGATPAALTTGYSPSLMLNMPLPRTWRLVYTIGGTSPSFALTTTIANYLL